MSDRASPSLYRSPQEAMQAPREEFLYLACLPEGTGTEKPDFLAVVDTEDGQIVHELPLANLGDELHHPAGTAARRLATDPTGRTWSSPDSARRGFTSSTSPTTRGGRRSRR